MIVFENKIGIPFKEVGKRLDILNKELNKNGMAIRADSEATIEFGDPRREVATAITLYVCFFEKQVFQKGNFLSKLLKRLLPKKKK